MSARFLEFQDPFRGRGEAPKFDPLGALQGEITWRESIREEREKSIADAKAHVEQVLQVIAQNEALVRRLGEEEARVQVYIDDLRARVEPS